MPPLRRASALLHGGLLLFTLAACEQLIGIEDTPIAVGGATNGGAPNHAGASNASASNADASDAGSATAGTAGSSER